VLRRIYLAPARALTLSPREWAVLIPFGVYCFVYPFAILLLSLDLMPFGMEWMSNLLLAMLGLTAGAWLWLNFGALGLAVGALIFALGIALEYVGVTTGLPFGSYRYTGVLVPGLPGGVPLAIGFAWLMVVVAGLFTARRLLNAKSETNNPELFRVSAVGALLVVGMDLLLEPVAYHVKGYWEWLEPGPGYYGVPWSNFAAWFVAALLMSLLLGAALKVRSVRWGWVPLALYIMNVILFGVVNLAHGLWLPSVIALALVGLVRLLTSRQTRARSLG
jgi:putative membrane protein